MKKAYETPTVEKIEFNYRDQIVVASAGAAAPMENGNTSVSSEFYSCFDIGDVIEYYFDRLQFCSMIFA